MLKALLALLLLLQAQNTFAGADMAPEFTLADTTGDKITLPRTHDGADIYLFWASWCPYCKALMLHLNDMLIDYGDDVTIYALNIRDDEYPAQFISDRGYEFVEIPEADSIMELYGVRPIPALFVVDGKGRIRFNLYTMFFDEPNEDDALSHSDKARMRAPRWADAIRKSVDKVLSESEAD